MVLPRSSTVAPLLALFVGLVVGSSFQSFRDANVLVYESKQLRSDAPHQSTGNDEILLKASVAEEEGWRSIQVFSGPPKSFTPNMLYSEVRQDAVVLALMRHQPGYFIDLASNDAQFLSNTAALERSYNWTGLCIEPNPKYWYDLAMTRKCQVVAAVVGDIRNEPVDFQMEKEGLGGIIGENFDNQQADDSSRVPSFTVTLLEILKRNNAPNVIDYMSLDIEGAESYVMMHFPFTSVSNHHL